MYDPRKILTKEGLEDYLHNIKTIEDSLFYITNNMDDLHIGAIDSKLEEAIYKFESILPILKTGNGEVLE
jgi:hypothetical protein